MPICPPPPTPLIAPFVGPPASTIKGLVPGSGCFQIHRAMHAALRDMPGAVVVVEDDAPSFLPKANSAFRFLQGKIHIFGASRSWNPAVGPNGPLWVDSSFLHTMGDSGQQKGFPIGWGY